MQSRSKHNIVANYSRHRTLKLKFWSSELQVQCRTSNLRPLTSLTTLIGLKLNWTTLSFVLWRSRSSSSFLVIPSYIVTYVLAEESGRQSYVIWLNEQKWICNWLFLRSKKGIISSWRSRNQGRQWGLITNQLNLSLASWWLPVKDLEVVPVCTTTWWEHHFQEKRECLEMWKVICASASQTVCHD